MSRTVYELTNRKLQLTLQQHAKSKPNSSQQYREQSRERAMTFQRVRESRDESSPCQWEWTRWKSGRELRSAHSCARSSTIQEHERRDERRAMAVAGWTRAADALEVRPRLLRSSRPIEMPSRWLVQLQWHL